MSRSAEEVAADLRANLPPGWVWPRGADSALAEVMAPFAASIAQVEREAELLMEEVDPRTATAFLPDFERVLGPDPCGRDVAALPIGERRQIAHARWTAKGGQSIPYFVRLAANLGVPIVVEEFWPSVAGGAGYPYAGLQAGQELVPEGEQFSWRVKLAPTRIIQFQAGREMAGDPLGWLVVSVIDCFIRRFSPAHTQVVFSYTLEPA